MRSSVLASLFGLLFVFSSLSLQAQSAAAAKSPGEDENCSKSGASANCERRLPVFSAPVQPGGGGHRSLIFHELNTYGPSINFGNAGGWTVTHLIEAPKIIFGTSGIDQYEGANILKNGTGDLAGLYLYVYGGGRAAQSDEGVTGLTVESGEISGYFHGTVAAGAGRGATALKLARDAGARQNHGYTCAGCMLVDISKGTIAGRLNGRSQAFGSTYLFELPTTAVTLNGGGGKLPLTRAWCETLTAIPAAAQAGVGIARTFNCRLGEIEGTRRPFKAEGVVAIAGPAYPEQAVLSAVGVPADGVQSLTILARNPNPAGAVIFQGGVAGQTLSFDANLAATGFRTSYYVFGSVDGVNLIYGSQIAGSLKGHQLPRLGAEAELIGSGFHLYPGAEIVANTAEPAAPVLEANNVDWTEGDLVENPRFQSYGGVGVRDVCTEVTPTDGDLSSSCMMLEMQGPGISGTYHPFRIVNHNRAGLYRQGGGVLDPVPVMYFEGAFGDTRVARNGPGRGPEGPGAVVDIRETAGRDTAPFNLFLLPGPKGAGAARVTYDPGTLLVGFPNGLVAGSLATAATCVATTSNVNCGSAVAGSVAIPAGAASITVASAAVTAGSQILVTADGSLGKRLGVACSRSPSAAFAPFGVSARVPGQSFTLTSTAADGPRCYSFLILN